MGGSAFHESEKEEVTVRREEQGMLLSVRRKDAVGVMMVRGEEMGTQGVWII